MMNARPVRCRTGLARCAKGQQRPGISELKVRAQTGIHADMADLRAQRHPRLRLYIPVVIQGGLETTNQYKDDSGPSVVRKAHLQ